MGTRSARTTFVVPSWNGRDLIGACLASIAAQTDRDHRIVVVDNGSADGTAEYLAAEWPNAVVLREGENRGFAAAVNRGVEASDSEFVALVNNDVELRPDWLERALIAFEGEERTGSVATKLLDGNHPGRLDGAGDVLGWDGYAARIGRGDADDGSFDRPAEVLSACAAAALYRREALAGTGPFDERFFAYLEDVDWGLRAQVGGWRCRYAPHAVAVHRPGSTSGRVPRFELYHAHRNMIWLMAKSYPGRSLWLYAPVAVGRRLGSLVKAALAGGAGTVLRAWWDGLREARGIRAEGRSARRAGASEWPRIRSLIRVSAR